MTVLAFSAYKQQFDVFPTESNYIVDFRGDVWKVIQVLPDRVVLQLIK